MPYPKKKPVKAFELPSSYVAVDLETTGLSPYKDRIIEIGAVKVVEGSAINEFETLVSINAPFSAEAQRISGITPDMLKGAMKESEAIAAFMRFCGSLPLVGHNAKAFDALFIEQALKRSRMDESPIWVDTMKLAGELYGGRISLAKLCNRFGITNQQAHRALPDATATHECYQCLIAEAKALSADARDFPDATGIGPLAGEVVCFTGESMAFSRHDLMQTVIDNGGGLSNNVTMKTTLLVDFGDGTTAKARKAREYADRTGVRIITSQEFFSRINAVDRRAVETGNAAPQAPKGNGCAATALGVFLAAVSVGGFLLVVGSIFSGNFSDAAKPFIVFVFFAFGAAVVLSGRSRK